MASVEAVKEFVLHAEKALTARRLYAPHMAPYREASERLLEKGREAVGDEGFTLRVGPTDLFLEKTSVVNRPKHEDSFFFPLYRDGMRELSFAPDVGGPELEAVLDVLEAAEKRTIDPAEDTITALWRRDLPNVTWSAIDGIGEQEAEEGEDDFGALVTDLVEKIKDPAPAATGQSYAFVVDADVQVGATDFHYESTTEHRAFEDSPVLLQLSAAEAGAIRAELGDEREGVLLQRFVEILLAILNDPGKQVPAALLTPVFTRLLQTHWALSDLGSLDALLTRLGTAAQGAPHPESRVAAHEAVVAFLSPERVGESLERIETGTLALDAASRLWEHAGDAVWENVVAFWSRLGAGDLREQLGGLLHSRLAFHPDLLRGALASEDAGLVRAALSLLDERLERVYASELIALVEHPDDSVRIKALALVGKLGGHEALEAVWRALETDHSRSVRLYAFRLVSSTPLPGMAERLTALVRDPAFGARPGWEREKYVRLLGRVAGDEARALFESWLPSGRRWLWQARDVEAAELAIHGLLSCGEAGRAKVAQIEAGGGKPAEIAAKVQQALRGRAAADMTIPPAAGAKPPRRPSGQGPR